MFWGLVLEPSKKYTQRVDQTFHISQAALDLKSCDSKPVQLVLEYENSNFVLATLSKEANIFQVPLDLIFKTGDEVSFRTIGNGKVHLSGYHVLEDLDSMLMNGEDESEIDELEEMEQNLGKRKKGTPKTKGGKKLKLDDTNEDDIDEEEEDDSEEDDINQSLGKKAQKKNSKANNSSLLSMNDEDEDDEDDEDFDEEDMVDFDEDESDEEEDDEDVEDEEMDFDLIADDSDEMTENSMNTSKNKKLDKKKGPQTPNGIVSSSKANEKSAQKNKNQKVGSPGKDGKTPKSENRHKGEKKPGSGEGTPMSKKNLESGKKEQKTPKSPKNEGSPQKKVLEGGVISEELRVGNGPVAKPGKMASVYYVGTLANSKKEFDSVQGGGGFKFRIGKNEVIKGWDIGINGMKVGGKRKLTIPPHLAYGSKGSPPVIPPNSTLVFTVELKGLS